MSNAQLGHTNLDRQVAADFSSARGRAFRNHFLAFLRGQDNNLLSFDEVRRCLRLREEDYVGVQPNARQAAGA